MDVSSFGNMYLINKSFIEMFEQNYNKRSNYEIVLQLKFYKTIVFLLKYLKKMKLNSGDVDDLFSVNHEPEKFQKISNDYNEIEAPKKRAVLLKLIN